MALQDDVAASTPVWNGTKLHSSLESKVNSSNWNKLQCIYASCKRQSEYTVDAEVQRSLKIHTSKLSLDGTKISKASESALFFLQMEADGDIGIRERLLRVERPLKNLSSMASYGRRCALGRHFVDLVWSAPQYTNFLSLADSIDFVTPVHNLQQLFKHACGGYRDKPGARGPDYTMHLNFWKEGIPHLRCVTQTDLEPDSENLLASEVVMMCTAIIANMCESHDVVHEVFPVMMLSSCYTSARCLMGWMDKKGTLQIYKTPFTNFVTDNILDEELLLRWFIGPAVGQTTQVIKQVASTEQQRAKPRTRCATNGPVTRSQTTKRPLGTASASSMNREIPEVRPKVQTRAKTSSQ